MPIAANTRAHQRNAIVAGAARAAYSPTRFDAAGGLAGTRPCMAQMAGMDNAGNTELAVSVRVRERGTQVGRLPRPRCLPLYLILSILPFPSSPFHLHFNCRLSQLGVLHLIGAYLLDREQFISSLGLQQKFGQTHAQYLPVLLASLIDMYDSQFSQFFALTRFIH